MRHASLSVCMYECVCVLLGVKPAVLLKCNLEVSSLDTIIILLNVSQYLLTVS